MIRSSLVALLLVAGLAPASRAAASPVRAAQGAQAAAQNAPVATAPAHSKPVKFRGTVINQTSAFITVQDSDPNHPNVLRTFTFSPQLKPKMQKILDAGGYQHGDKVAVKTLPGSNVALSISGRPSKPI